MSYNHAFTRKAFKLATGDDLSSSNIIHRMLHPAQDLQLMESIQHDVGLAPGLALYFDDEHVRSTSWRKPISCRQNTSPSMARLPRPVTGWE
ncbi:TPA: hypothetical protein ACVGJS_003642 [Pseudomonas aeruginosa]